MRELRFFGADGNITELRGPVCRPEDLAAVVITLEDVWRTQNLKWDWVQWRGLRLPGEVTGESNFCDVLHARFELTMHYLLVPGDWGFYRASLPRNIKESLRKCYNSLSRDGFTFIFKVVSEPDEAEAALCRFLDLHHLRSRVSDTVVHPDVFAASNTRQFLLEYGIALAKTGDLRVFQLIIAGEIVATRIGIALGDELYLYYSGYDPAWRRYSVMTTVVAEAIRWAIENRFRVVNLATGTDVSKTRWRPQQAVYAGGDRVAPGYWARLAYVGATAVRRRRARR